MELDNLLTWWSNGGHKKSPYGIRVTDSGIMNTPKSKGIVTTKIVKVGRNEKCPCSSGKKYKKCCMN